jgi:hypothetical protein
MSSVTALLNSHPLTYVRINPIGSRTTHSQSFSDRLSQSTSPNQRRRVIWWHYEKTVVRSPINHQPFLEPMVKAVHPEFNWEKKVVASSSETVGRWHIRSRCHSQHQTRRMASGPHCSRNNRSRWIRPLRRSESHQSSSWISSSSKRSSHGQD